MIIVRCGESMPKKLKDFQKEQEERLWKYREVYPKPNGIACPECGAELYDSDSVILTSYPPKRNINCSECEYTGTRIC